MSRDKNIIYIASNKYAISDGWHKLGISDRGAEERKSQGYTTNNSLRKIYAPILSIYSAEKKREKHIHDYFENDLRILELR